MVPLTTPPKLPATVTPATQAMAGTLPWHQLDDPPTAIMGTSTMGHPIPYYQLPHHAPTETQLSTLYIGCFHGDEPLSAEVVVAFYQWCRTHHFPNPYPPGPIGFIPLFNPDGYLLNQRQNGRGVDLNRNYPTQNWAENEKNSPYYSGPAPASEPETQAMIEFLKTYRPQKIITLHTPYRVINYDGPHSEPIARAMAAETGYPAVADIGYPTPGSFGNYAGIEGQTPTITIELPEDEPWEIVWEANRRSLLTAMGLSPTLT